MSDAALWVAAVSPVTTLLGVLGGYWLAGRNEEKRDQRAATREEAARRAALTERLSDQRHEIQRETLFELQNELQALGLATSEILATGVPLRQSRPREEVDTVFNEKMCAVLRLQNCILDLQLREAISAFTAICECVRFSGVDRRGNAVAARWTELMTEFNDCSEVRADKIDKLVECPHGEMGYLLVTEQQMIEFNDNQRDAVQTQSASS